MAVLTVEQHVDGVLAGDPAVLARTITLLESSSPARRADAQAVLAQLLPHSGGSLRVGITGVPGVGKSTFIDQLGLNLVEAGHKVARINTVAAAVTPHGWRNASSRTGLYAAAAARLTGFAFSGRMRPRTRYQISTGTSVIDSNDAATIA